MMFGYGDWGWSFFHGVGALFMLAIAVLVLWGVVAAVNALGRDHRQGGGEDHALTILRERYARGEITQEQFEQMKRDLG